MIFDESISGTDARCSFCTVRRRLIISINNTQPSIQWVPVFLFPEVKRQGHEAGRSPPSAAEVKKGLSIYLSTALQSFVGPWLLFSFLILYTVRRTPCMGDQPFARTLPTYRTTQTQNKHTQTSMP
jgi:hypothetical protein